MTSKYNKHVFFVLNCVICVFSVNIEFKIKRHISCASVDGDELYVYNLSLEQCVKHCALRSTCVGVSYKRAARTCALYQLAESLALLETAVWDDEMYGSQCVLIYGTDISKSEVPSTQTCNQYMEYNPDSGQCEHRECRPLHVSYGTIYGNIQTIGSRLVYTCDIDSTSRNKSVCLEDGSWNLEPQCDFCLQYLVPAIPDSQLSASTYFSDMHIPSRGRLDVQEQNTANYLAGSWSAQREESDANAYIQATFPEVMRVKGIVTKGRNGRSQFVTSYQLANSVDCVSAFIDLMTTDGSKMTFDGNNDSDTERINYLVEPIDARCIRIKILTYAIHRSMRFDIIGCSEGCTTNLVSGPYGVPDSNLHASSWDESTARPAQARLNTPGTVSQFGGWFTEQGSDDSIKHYIQVRFHTKRTVSSVVTQGVDWSLQNYGTNPYTSTYTVQYSDDCQTFYNIEDPQTNDAMVFIGNTDWSSTVENALPTPIEAFCVRIIPETFSERKGLRFELKGCIDHTCPESPKRKVKPNPIATFEIRIHPETFPYSDANARCSENNGDLVDLTIPEIYEYVTTLLKSCSAYAGCSSYWIGSDDLNVQTCVVVPDDDGPLQVMEDALCEPKNGYICQWNV